LEVLLLIEKMYVCVGLVKDMGNVKIISLYDRFWSEAWREKAQSVNRAAHQQE
jgi:hypothetical protein